MNAARMGDQAIGARRPVVDPLERACAPSPDRTRPRRPAARRPRSVKPNNCAVAPVTLLEETMKTNERKMPLSMGFPQR